MKQKRSAAELGGIPVSRIAQIRQQEVEAFRQARPKTARKASNGLAGYFGGVPMHWMLDWPLPFQMLVEKAKGSTITDIDGNVLADFCLGDTGSMFGHSPAPVVRAIRKQAAKGLTYMLPTEDAAVVGRLLQEKFGLAHWQIATTATDANRFALRMARAVTNRPKILVFNGCYHGSVDETFVKLDSGKAKNKPSLAGQFIDLTQNTKIIEFNDLATLEAALKDRDVACVITEPVLTNSCMVLPHPSFHAGLRKLTKKYGTLLLIDETHTISSGPGGYTKRYGLDPDIFVLGKPIAGGVPASVWGMSEAVATRFANYNRKKVSGYSGMGTTLSGNPLQFAAMRATLEEVITEKNYAHMEKFAARLESGLFAVIASLGLPWHVARVGARVEFICAPGPLRNGSESERAQKPALEQAIHISLVNRGVLIAPFHNMMLLSPATTARQVDTLVSAFGEIAADLAA
ncbi:MAG TPA: aspartate aminotransferase family protein [Rhizobiaceae bacterium]|nr:aspartate aminotransferase family protein [Rhizobiaceae bacterium]